MATGIKSKLKSLVGLVKAYGLSILTLLLMLLLIPFTKVAGFSPFQVPDVFTSFYTHIWIFLSAFSVMVIFSLKSYANIRGLPKEHVEAYLLFVSMYIWFLFYIIPGIVNYPLFWKSTEEQVLFAKALAYGINYGNYGWPASYLLLIAFSQLLGLNILSSAPLLAMVMNFVTPITIFLLCKRLISSEYAFFAPILFAFPQTYYYRYFSDYLYGFSLFLILVYLISRLNEKAEISTFIPLILLFASLTVGHPITSLVYIVFLSVYALGEFIRFRNKGVFKTLVLIAVIFISWYAYNQLAFQATSPYITYILRMERISHALSPQAYIGTPYHENLSYAILYYSRYSFFAMLAITALLGLIIIRRKDARKMLILLSLVLASLMLWLALKATVRESFSNRFIVFGTLPVVLASTYALSRKLRHIRYLVLALLPLSFALAFFPSTYMLFTHEYEFIGGEFIHHISGDTFVVTDGYSANFIALYNLHVRLIKTVDDATIFNVDPVKIYIPSFPHIVYRSLRQEVQAFISFHRDPRFWEALDQRLSDSHNLCYTNGYIVVWFWNYPP